MNTNNALKNHNIGIYGPQETWPQGVLLPQQIHGAKILEVKTQQDDLSGCDALWTERNDLTLGIQTADCAPVAFWNADLVGIAHIGWRGLVNGLSDKLNTFFVQKEVSNVFVGPILPSFVIQKDFCYEALKPSFGACISENDSVFFDFKKALQKTFPNAEFDPRSTFNTNTLASWRRDQSSHRNLMTIKFGAPESLSQNPLVLQTNTVKQD